MTKCLKSRICGTFCLVLFANKNRKNITVNEHTIKRLIVKMRNTKRISIRPAVFSGARDKGRLPFCNLSVAKAVLRGGFCVEVHSFIKYNDLNAKTLYRQSEKPRDTDTYPVPCGNGMELLG